MVTSARDFLSPHDRGLDFLHPVQNQSQFRLAHRLLGGVVRGNGCDVFLFFVEDPAVISLSLELIKVREGLNHRTGFVGNTGHFGREVLQLGIVRPQRCGAGDLCLDGLKISLGCGHLGLSYQQTAGGLHPLEFGMDLGVIESGIHLLHLVDHIGQHIDVS